MRLGHADGEAAKAQFRELARLLFRRGQQLRARAAIDAAGDGIEFFLDGHGKVVAVLEAVFRLAEAHHFLGQRHAAFAALAPYLGEGHVHAQRAALFFDQFQFRLGIVREAVDGHHAGQAVDICDVGHVAQKVRQSLFQRREVFVFQFLLFQAAVQLQRPHRGHHHHRRGAQARHAALDVEELFRAEVRAEAGLGDGVIAQFQGHARGQHAVAAVGDVGKGAAVDERRGVFQRLHQIGLERVLEKRRHRPRGLEVAGGDGLFVVGIADDDARKALF